MSASRLETRVGPSTDGADSPVVRCCHGVARGERRRPSGRVGFSLIELVMVLGITVLLTSILFPAFRGVRESAQRLSCASNMRQIGTAFALYGMDFSERLPTSKLTPTQIMPPQEQMAATAGPGVNSVGVSDLNVWNGLGLIVSGRYLDSPACLYCASHSGEHPFERYQHKFFDKPDGKRIYTNYHYVGGEKLGSGGTVTPLMNRNEHSQLLLVDGMRMQDDFNHLVGTNVLHGDNAVSWCADAEGTIRSQIPIEVLSESKQIQVYVPIWKLISERSVKDAKQD